MTVRTETERGRPVATLDESKFLSTARANEKLVVACILDEFSAQCFAPEADFVPLSPHNWEVELCASQPDLLLVESAWRGHRDMWWNAVLRLGPELLGILAWCRERNIPTAFWNKEDPVHFGTFIRVAAEFDSVFTTDMDCVPRYKARLGHDRVHFLPFAAQPALHNPIETFERADGTAFAGAYYRKYPERTADLDSLSVALRRRGGGLAIYDRNYGRALPENEFPPEFRSDIVGGLKPSEIGIAYKGYTKNLNLNSVKQSQSMFARRVFELMASNTLVVSNFSRGLRLMFGDLVVSTDVGDELERRLDRLEALPMGVERVRLAALRKVLREHTYGRRLDFIADVNGVETAGRIESRVLIVAHVSTPEDAQSLRDAVRRQSWTGLAVAVYLAEGVQPEDVIASDAQGLELWDVLERLDVASVVAAAERADCDMVTAFAPADHYGVNHITDAVLALEWTSLAAAGRAQHFGVRGSTIELVTADSPYVPHDAMALTRSVLRLDALRLFPAGQAVDSLEVAGLAIDPFNYCKDGAGMSTQQLATVTDLDLDLGQSLSQMQHHASLGRIDADDTFGVPLSDLVDGLTSRRDVDIDLSGTEPEITSRLEPGRHTYVYSSTVLGLEMLNLETDDFVFFECAPGLDLMLTLIFVDAQGERLGHTMVSNLRNTKVEAPDGAQGFKLGLRILGPGRTVIKKFIAHQHHEASSGILCASRDVVVTNIYPAYGNLYRNGFIHSRVRGYRERGKSVDVLVPNASSRSAFREFEDVDVAEVPADELSDCLASGEVDNVLVHFLDPSMWAALRDQPNVQRINVWVHGSEVQPWWRRAFNYTSDEQREVAKVASAARMEFWREVFSEAPANMRFVFVSRQFAESVFEDIGRRLPEDRYSVIHNPIDTSIFTYAPKPAAQRRKILSIRPYATRMYANDLSVEAVRLLSDRPGFDELEFCFIGDGPLFEETLEPLRAFENVEVRRQFLTHREIADIHKDFGVFLVPTRWDSHGVSRDEAMSSGLVPVTSAAAAVPEFVDATCGFLADEEDAGGLAEAIWALAHDEKLFTRMSAAAAERVRGQAAAERVIAQELSLFADPGL